MLESLIGTIATLPGLGNKSAKRIVLHLLTSKSNPACYLADLLKHVSEKMERCKVCNNLCEVNPCKICSDASRSQKEICIVESVEDLWHIESSSYYKGLYHVIEKDEENRSSSFLEPKIESLLSRLKEEKVEELILANSSTPSGQINIFYISDTVRNIYNDKIKITALGRGIPVGSEIDYLDEGTIRAAFDTRKSA